jgi:hypothetical protein
MNASSKLSTHMNQERGARSHTPAAGLRRLSHWPQSTNGAERRTSPMPPPFLPFLLHVPQLPLQTKRSNYDIQPPEHALRQLHERAQPQERPLTVLRPLPPGREAHLAFPILPAPHALNRHPQQKPIVSTRQQQPTPSHSVIVDT